MFSQKPAGDLDLSGFLLWPLIRFWCHDSWLRTAPDKVCTPWVKNRDTRSAQQRRRIVPSMSPGGEEVMKSVPHSCPVPTSVPVVLVLIHHLISWVGFLHPFRTLIMWLVYTLCVNTCRHTFWTFSYRAAAHTQFLLIPITILWGERDVYYFLKSGRQDKLQEGINNTGWSITNFKCEPGSLTSIPLFFSPSFLTHMSACLQKTLPAHGRWKFQWYGVRNTWNIPYC